MLSGTSSPRAPLPDAMFLAEPSKAGELSAMPVGVGAKVSWSVANAHDSAMDASSKVRTQAMAMRLASLEGTPTWERTVPRGESHWGAYTPQWGVPAGE
eukprot:CAMPEP_0177509544 /NCGR_PEP_ID=MMETSP0369-20130122/41627_1 /TAXON_ID=447022 ORGANISM="Scrippsiella hangoei-like, Strain SHHI-4" /NCGR_SAMPLE_ID=MMETSP0369 /ASSEMBLY_ACC=CAM_ASM_000364 /LENGTH=98 /DNA_ID=CAMNT_0018987749 /DNA_START=726 /DNA_END=1019 /DNA_ORIENTATION=-